MIVIEMDYDNYILRVYDRGTGKDVYYAICYCAYDIELSAEKQVEEAQRSREYGYVHPTVDDYDESLDDPNYEGVEEP